MASSRSSSGDSSPDPYAPAWQRMRAAVLDTPGGALSADERNAIARGDDPAKLAMLLAKVRTRAYAIVDRDVGGIDVDVLVEAALAAALGEADMRRRAALEAIG